MPQTVAFMPFDGGELFGPESAPKSAPVMMDRGFAARTMLGMGAIVKMCTDEIEWRR